MEGAMEKVESPGTEAQWEIYLLKDKRDGIGILKISGGWLVTRASGILGRPHGFVFVPDADHENKPIPIR